MRQSRYPNLKYPSCDRAAPRSRGEIQDLLCGSCEGDSHGVCVVFQGETGEGLGIHRVAFANRDIINN